MAKLDITIPPEAEEAAAKADCEAAGVNPMCLHQHHGFPGDPHTDHVDDQGRMYHYAWRTRVPRVRAACLAMLRAWPGMHGGPSPADARRHSIILPMQKETGE